MTRLIVAIAIGAIIAVGATFAIVSSLASAANGTPSNQSLYNYGSH